MSNPKVAVVGYGVIGQRLADGVALQKDMELAGVVDVAPTLAIRALHEIGHALQAVRRGRRAEGRLRRDRHPGVGHARRPARRGRHRARRVAGRRRPQEQGDLPGQGVKAIFQGGEKNDIVDVFFHGYANYEKGVGKDYLKLTSCNTTGLIRAVDCLDREVGVETRHRHHRAPRGRPGRHASRSGGRRPGRARPNHQALDLMTIMPHIEATGLLVHVPTTHGHIINVIATTKGDTPRSSALELFEAHPRIRNVKIADGFNSNASLFRYARDLGQQARRHVRDRRLRRDHRQERPRVHVRHQHPAGSRS